MDWALALCQEHRKEHCRGVAVSPNHFTSGLPLSAPHLVSHFYTNPLNQITKFLSMTTQTLCTISLFRFSLLRGPAPGYLYYLDWAHDDGPREGTDNGSAHALGANFYGSNCIAALDRHEDITDDLIRNVPGGARQVQCS